MLITERGGLIGRYAFWAMIPVYIAFAVSLYTGHIQIGHIALFEAICIGAFGLSNGYALHKLAQDPTFGVEELSLHRITKA